MDSWHSTYLEATGPQAALNPAIAPGQFVWPSDSATFIPPADGPKELRKYTVEDWDAHKSEITRLYNDNTLESVRDFMRKQHGLDATPKQYKDRIKKWGLDKNIKTAEMEAIIRKQRERALTKNKASAFRVRKRPVNQEKINRYISEHKLPSSNDDLDIGVGIDSAVTPTGISVYTPSDTGLRTPLAASSPQGSSKGYTSYGNLERQTPAPPSILSNPELFSTPSTPRSPISHMLLASPVFNTPSPQPSSPALSISSIIRPTTSTFTGQSPAITPRTLSVLPRVSSQTQEGFQDQATLSLSNISASAVRIRTEPQGRYRQAEEEQLREELSLIEIMLGESHSEYLEKSMMIADIVLEQGRYRSAEEIIRKSISVFKTEDRDNIYKLKAQGILGRILHHQGFYKQAEKIQSETLQSQKRVLGTEDPSTLASMHGLTLVYMQQKRWKEAEDLCGQVLEIKMRVLGQDNISTVKSAGNLAQTYKAQKRWTEAEDLSLQLIERQTGVLGREHPDTLITMGSLASLYMDEGRLKDAEDLEVYVLETMTRVLGQEHPDTLITMGNLASLYKDQGRLKEAEDLHVQALELKTRVLGQEHPHTLSSMHNLASTWNKAGRFADSVKLMEECRQLKIRILGASHPNTLNSKKLLLEWQRGN